MRLIHLLPLLLTRFRKEALLFWRVVTHRATPLPAKLLALLAVLYVILPIDLIPDFIPILGWLDDIGVVAFMLNIAYRFLPPQRYAALRAGVYGGTASATTSGTGVKREPVIIDVTPENSPPTKSPAPALRCGAVMESPYGMRPLTASGFVV